MLNSLFFLLEGETTTPSGLPSWVTFVMLGGVAVFFYFFMIRPQRKQEKEANNMRNSLEIGDEVVTIGGIIGQIVSIKGDTVTIATSKDRNKIRFLKTAIREVTVKANAVAEEAAAESSSDDAPVVKD
ncbi:MAG: preprotein translocase subunit YajC [Clostridia bacterium]|nr:preprotein translocase subunit YajC [Clostridia bacterium]